MKFPGIIFACVVFSVLHGCNGKPGYGGAGNMATNTANSNTGSSVTNDLSKSSDTGNSILIVNQKATPGAASYNSTESNSDFQQQQQSKTGTSTGHADGTNTNTNTVGSTVDNQDSETASSFEHFEGFDLTDDKFDMLVKAINDKNKQGGGSYGGGGGYR